MPDHQFRIHLLAGPALALLIGSTAASQARADVEFTPSIDISQSWVDNVSLAAGSGSESAFITQVRPGFLLEQTNTRMESRVDYQFQGVFDLSESDRNESYHQLDATSDIQLLSDLFYVNLNGLITQQVIDARAPASIGNIVDTGGNMTDAYTASITPYLIKRFGGTIAEARYSYGFVKYDAEESIAGDRLDDSTNTRVSLSWGTDPEELTRFTWMGRFDRHETDYDDAGSLKYSQASLELGYQIMRRLRLIGIGGYESDLVADLDSGDLDEPYWQAGFALDVGRSHQLEALVGDRFYGTSYEFSYTYMGRILEIESSYTEDPMTAADELFSRPGTSGPILQPSIPDSDLTHVTSDVFVRKYFDTAIRLVGRRTEIELRFGDYRREYLTGPLPDDRTREVGLGLTRQLSSRTELELRADWHELRGEDGGTVDDVGFEASLLRRLSDTLEVRFEIGRTERTGDFTEYDVNWATIGLTKTF